MKMLRPGDGFDFHFFSQSKDTQLTHTRCSWSEAYDEYKHNHFINNIKRESEQKLSILTVYDLKIEMTTSEKTKIFLKDIRESKFGEGTVWRKSGFTKDEWTAYLKEKNYILDTIN